LFISFQLLWCVGRFFMSGFKRLTIKGSHR
jgi:hypothetical protein